jgi:hypothetical protein
MVREESKLAQLSSQGSRVGARGGHELERRRDARPGLEPTTVSDLLT